MAGHAYSRTGAAKNGSAEAIRRSHYKHSRWIENPGSLEARPQTIYRTAPALLYAGSAGPMPGSALYRASMLEAAIGQCCAKRACLVSFFSVHTFQRAGASASGRIFFNASICLNGIRTGSRSARTFWRTGKRGAGIRSYLRRMCFLLHSLVSSEHIYSTPSRCRCWPARLVLFRKNTAL
jgi:hypothetical protein